MKRLISLFIIVMFILVGCGEKFGGEVIQKDFRIDEMKFCYSIDDDFNCEEDLFSEFRKGDTVNLYFEVVSFSYQENSKKSYDYEFSVAIETTGPDGKIVEQLTDDNLLTSSGTVDEVEEVIEEYIPVHYFEDISTDYPVGEYTMTAMVVDQSGRTISDSINFQILK